MRRTLFFLSLLLTALLLVVLVRGLFVTQYRVADSDGGDLLAGDRVLVNRMAYGWRIPGAPWWGYTRLGSGQPSRGDYVAVYDSFSDGSDSGQPVRVTRVRALPGDTLWFDARRRVLSATRPAGEAFPQPVSPAGSRVKVTPWNARLLWEALCRYEGSHAVLEGDTVIRLDGKRVASIRFPQSYYWVEGVSGYGLVPHSALVGRAFCISYSIDDRSEARPRWRMNRFFIPL